MSYFIYVKILNTLYVLYLKYKYLFYIVGICSNNYCTSSVFRKLS